MNDNITREELMAGIFGRQNVNGKTPININASKIVEVDLEDIRDFGGGNREHKFLINEKKVKEIADSIDIIGKIFMPCILRYDPDNIKEYECLAGMHRRRAAELKGLKTVPALIIDCDNDVEANAISAINKTQRESLTIMERDWKFRY